MAKLPKVVGLVLCRDMEVDPTTGEVSLVGILQSRGFNEWPSPVQRFMAYAALHDRVGGGTMQ